MADINSLTPEEALVAGGFLASWLWFSLFLYILTAIAGWKILEKAGEKGWKSFIPIYNLYLFYKIVGLKDWFWAILFVSIVSQMIFIANGFDVSMTQEEFNNYDWNGHGIVIGALIIDLAVGLIAEIKYAISTSKAFGKSKGFAVALLFLPNICWLILGLGKAKYNKKAIKQ